MTPNEAIPPRPKAVVFDLGKVLLEFDFGIAARTLAPASAVTAEEFQRALDQSPLLHDYESGRIDSRRFYEGVVSRTGYRGAEPEFRASFADIFSEIGPMVELHAQLRAGGVPAFVFSNTNEIAVTHIRARFAFFRDFDGHVLSYEVGAMKPLPEIYAAVEAATGHGGDSLLFIDDRAENVAAAVARGWQGLHHVDQARTPAEVRRLVGL